MNSQIQCFRALQRPEQILIRIKSVSVLQSCFHTEALICLQKATNMKLRRVSSWFTHFFALKFAALNPARAKNGQFKLCLPVSRPYSVVTNLTFSKPLKTMNNQCPDVWLILFTIWQDITYLQVWDNTVQVIFIKYW